MPAILASSFLFDRPPFRSCHASTIAETSPGQFCAAWFAGEEEGAPDVGIWLSRSQADGWSAPVELATGQQSESVRFPCWNPVLFQLPAGDLRLFYKVGPSPREWWGMEIHSPDGGRGWSEPVRLPGIGPVKNKPICLPGDDLLCPSSSEVNGEWTVHLERCAADGSWSRTPPLNHPMEYQAIQPVLLTHPDGRLQILCRSRQGFILTSFSADSGFTWSPLALTSLPNPDSGIDAVTLQDGRHALVYNPVQQGRTPLVLAFSANGLTWQNSLVFEDQPGEYSYPAVIQSVDGRLHITYTWNRVNIRYVVVGI